MAELHFNLLIMRMYEVLKMLTLVRSLLEGKRIVWDIEVFFAKNLYIPFFFSVALWFIKNF